MSDPVEAGTPAAAPRAVPAWLWGAAGAGACLAVGWLEPNMVEEGLVVHVAQCLVRGEHLYRDVLFFTGPLPFELLALELNPNDAQAYYDRALAYYRHEDWDQALADASRALDLNPKHTRAYLIRGDAYLEKRDFDQALADFNLALECNPQDDMAYFNRGLAYSKKGDWRRAMEDWSRTLELNPRYANAYYFKAEFLERAGEKKEALEAYQGYLRYAPASAGKYLDEVRERIKALEK